MSAALKVLIASSSEDEEFAVAVGDVLKRSRPDEPLSQFSITHWRDLFVCNYGYFETLNKAVDTFDFAIFVGAPDDRLVTRGSSYHAVRDNVIFEFGMFLGSIGRDRAYLVIPDDFQVRLPSDLTGVSVHSWGAADSDDPEAAVRSISLRLRRDFLRKGPRPALEPVRLLTRDEVHQNISSVEQHLTPPAATTSPTGTSPSEAEAGTKLQPRIGAAVLPVGQWDVFDPEVIDRR